MKNAEMVALDLTEIELVNGGSIDAEPGFQYLVPPFIEWPEPGKPVVNPGIPLPPIY